MQDDKYPNSYEWSEEEARKEYLNKYQDPATQRFVKHLLSRSAPPASPETPVTRVSCSVELTKPKDPTQGTPKTFEALNRLPDDDIPF